MSSIFKLQSEFKPEGDQPEAIRFLNEGLVSGMKHQTLLGVTGSGKTFTMANVIANFNKPTLVIAHNKTLAAQLAQEYKQFFPENAVHYFVSYYDYYQPEAYIPTTDTYIEKDAKINEEIDRLRHASTQALLSRKDVIIVASVSCIYNLGSPKEYQQENLVIKVGDKMTRNEFLRKLVDIFFERTNADLGFGKFRAVGGSVEVMPANEKVILNILFEENRIKEIIKVDAISRQIVEKVSSLFIFPAKHFVTDKDKVKKALLQIKADLADRLKVLKKEGKNLEAERLKRRTNYDLEMIKEVGYCSGIENYSRYFSGKKSGEATDTLLSYFPHKKDGTPDFLTVVDESHVTIPQIGGMYAGDRSRKQNLVEFGFRLSSALDNRPLKFNEFEERVGQVVYTSATPGSYEKEQSQQIAEQIIRPTGLIDPKIEVRPVIETTGYKGQVYDFIKEAESVINKGGRVIATTLTKKMAEDLSDFLKERKIKAEYLHSEIKTIERIKILSDFRRGVFDCLVGVNLLREGLDLPELVFIGILDADREGFLRSETSLIQIIGRAARNVNGKVILYADKVTNSMNRAMNETERRRKIQLQYNKKHNITPKTISKAIHDITEAIETEHEKTVRKLIEVDRQIYGRATKKIIKEKEKQMKEAVKILDFETAAILRDEIKILLEGRDKKIKIKSR